MTTDKGYFDADGSECSLLELVHREPEWACNRIRQGEKFDKLARQARAILTRLEWSGTYSSCTGWDCCPVCSGIKPGMGYDPVTHSYPDKSGHREDCELKQYLSISD